MKIASAFMLFTTVLLYVVTPVTAFAVAQIDFTKPVEDHSMLLLLCVCVIGALMFLFAKLVFSKMDSKIDLLSNSSEKAEEKLKENELSQIRFEAKSLSDRLSKLENEHHTCQRQIPTIYVSKFDFDRFVETHREDITNITLRIEGIIRDLKAEIRSDMESQIERIIALLNNKLK